MIIWFIMYEDWRHSKQHNAITHLARVINRHQGRAQDLKFSRQYLWLIVPFVVAISTLQKQFLDRNTLSGILRGVYSWFPRKYHCQYWIIMIQSTSNLLRKLKFGISAPESFCLIEKEMRQRQSKCEQWRLNRNLKWSLSNNLRTIKNNSPFYASIWREAMRLWQRVTSPNSHCSTW